MNQKNSNPIAFETLPVKQNLTSFYLLSGILATLVAVLSFLGIVCNRLEKYLIIADIASTYFNTSIFLDC